MNNFIDFKEAYEKQDDKPDFMYYLSLDVFNKIIFEDKRIEGNITKWINDWKKKPENEKVFSLFNKIILKVNNDEFDSSKIKSPKCESIHSWQYDDPRVVINELFESTKIDERVLTIADKEEIKAECPSDKKKGLDALIDKTILRSDLKGIEKDDSGKWRIDFNNEELKEKINEKKQKGVDFKI